MGPGFFGRNEPLEQIQPGQVVAGGRYALLEVLGAGGLATVFLARDQQRGLEVALKVLRDRYVARPERAERLRREFEYAARVEHPAVIEVFEQGTLEDGRPYFAMERVPGRPLSHVISGSGGLPYPRLRRIARALAVALQAVHRAGVVHRDLKPANVLLLPDDRIKLIDFGLAGETDAPDVPAGHPARLTRVNDLLGTPEYMAPEQVLKQAPRRSMDMFALGVVMYELLTSITPYSGMGGREYVELQIAGDPALRSAERWCRIRDAPEALAELIDQCRRRALEERPASMGEVVRRLDALEDGVSEDAVLAARGSWGRSAVSVHAMQGDPVAPLVGELDAAVPVELVPPAAAEPIVPMGAVSIEPVLDINDSGVVAVMPSGVSGATPSGEELPLGTGVVAAGREPSAARSASGLGTSAGWWRPAVVLIGAMAAAVVLWMGLRGPQAEPEGVSATVVQAGAAVPEAPSVLVGTPGQQPSEDDDPTSDDGPSGQAESAEPAGSPSGPEESTAGETGQDVPSEPVREAPVRSRSAAKGSPGRASHKQRAKSRGSHQPAGEPKAAAEPGPSEAECAKTMEKATAAFDAYRWSAVLAHTRDASCWADHRAEYLRMRTEALMEEERWSECVRTGRRSSEPSVRLYAKRCQKRLDTITGTP